MQFFLRQKLKKCFKHILYLIYLRRPILQKNVFETNLRKLCLILIKVRKQNKNIRIIIILVG